MISRSISDEYISRYFEDFIPVQVNRSVSKEDEYSDSSMDSRSNSIVDEDNYNKSARAFSEPIPIPIPSPHKVRTREVNYDGKTTSDKRCLTPTPTKYYIQLEENTQKVRSMFTKQ